MSSMVTCDKLGQTLTTWLKTNKNTWQIAKLFEQLGLWPPVPYAAGLQVQDPRFTVVYDDTVWAAVPSKVPFTTGAQFDPSKWQAASGSGGSPQPIDWANLRVFATTAQMEAATGVPAGAYGLPLDTLNIYRWID